MSSLGTSKGILEIAKFGVYVTVPIVLMYVYASNTDNTLHKFIGKVLPTSLLWINRTLPLGTRERKSYIEYPKDTQKPPPPEELREMARELARKRNNP
ncbi:hypothetical protein L195_g026872 [Trifolium pratense]|uniref:Uncharacterized protein n=1 Tax=Trifolium pratense TaxID=57577 RepID=A0A2K3NKM0_TRIPR|nr:hypothetical protein L195_g026872 [Trifolium pratense]